MAAKSIAFDGDEAKVDKVLALKRTAEQGCIFSSKKMRPSSRRSALVAAGVPAEKSIKVQTQQRRDQLTKARQLGFIAMPFSAPSCFIPSMLTPMTHNAPQLSAGGVSHVPLPVVRKRISLLADDYDSD